MANKTFIGEEIFEFKPMGGLETKVYNTPGSGDFAIPTDPSPAGGGSGQPTDPSPAGGGSRQPIDPSPTEGGPKGGPGQIEEPPEQPEDDDTPEKSSTLTILAIGLLALFFLRKK